MPTMPGKRPLTSAAKTILAAEVAAKGSARAAQDRGVDIGTLHSGIAGASVRRGTAALLEATDTSVTTPAAVPTPDVVERLERLFGASSLTGEQVFERLEAMIAKLDQLDVLLDRTLDRANAAKAA